MAEQEEGKLIPVVKITRSDVPLKIGACAHRAIGAHIPIGYIKIEPQLGEPFTSRGRAEYDTDAQAIFEVLHDCLPSGTFDRLIDLFDAYRERQTQRRGFPEHF